MKGGFTSLNYLQGGKDTPAQKDKKNHKNHKKHKILTKSKSHYKKDHCSPKKMKSSSKQDMSCLNQELLYKISEVLNKFHGADIKGSDSGDLYEQICTKMEGISKCKSEKCWLSFHELIKNLSSDERKEFKESFKHKMPDSWKKNPTEWLNTSDIEKCLEQYHDLYDHFKCYGALPMDFSLKKNNDCVSGDLCKIDLKKHFEEGKHNVGIVLNLDDHDEPGSHWVAIYIELLPRNRDKPSMYYFDSIADKPTKEVNRFVKEIQKQYKDLRNEEIEFLYNDIQHQKKNTECGIYCIHFITTMLEGVDFKEYIQEIKDDAFMQKFRSYFFIE